MNIFRISNYVLWLARAIAIFSFAILFSTLIAEFTSHPFHKLAINEKVSITILVTYLFLLLGAFWKKFLFGILSLTTLMFFMKYEHVVMNPFMMLYHLGPILFILSGVLDKLNNSDKLKWKVGERINL